MTDILYTISQQYNTFTGSYKTIANYLMENINSTAFETLKDLADHIGVSTTTVIRFARELGYSGYSEMQRDIQTGLKDKISLPARLSASRRRYTNENQLLRETFEGEINNIESTLRELNADALEKTLEAISLANHVYLMGLRGSFSLAVYAYARLGQIRRGVKLIQTPGMLFPEDMINLEKGDLCLAFFFSRYSRSAANIINWLKKKGVFIVLITDEHYREVEKYGDVVLPCRVKNNSIKNTYVAPMCLLDYLINGVAMQDYDKAREILEETEQFLANGYYLGL